MKPLIIILLIICVGCSAAQIVPDERTIGPCYGSFYLSEEIMGCFYDVDKDKEPDIVLFYAWTGEELVLIMARAMGEMEL